MFLILPGTGSRGLHRFQYEKMKQISLNILFNKLFVVCLSLLMSPCFLCFLESRMLYSVFKLHPNRLS